MAITKEELAKMLTPTEKFLIELYEKSKDRPQKMDGNRFLYYQDRPEVISYGDGTSVRLENHADHPEYKHFDIVTIETPRGAFGLNDLLNQPVTFMDVGEEFQYQGTYDDPPKHYVFYGSTRLKEFQGNVYCLLHELCHSNYSHFKFEKPILEKKIWDDADELVEMMGLRLFENDDERRLYRDVCLRTYDPFNEKGIVDSTLMTEITNDKYDFYAVNGLIEASMLGMPLTDLCENLIRERK